MRQNCHILDPDSYIVVAVRKKSHLGRVLLRLAKKSGTTPETYLRQAVEDWIIFHRKEIWEEEKNENGQ